MAEVLDHMNLERRGWRVNRRAICQSTPHESLKKYGDAVRVGEVVMRMVSPCAEACCCIEFWTRQGDRKTETTEENGRRK